MNVEIDENLTFKHYKEPLRSIPKSEGTGFYGAILMTKDMDKIQCHICGEVFRSLNGHIRLVHETTVEEYKERFKLARSTALISESLRFEFKNKTIEHFNKMTESERTELKRKAREAQLANFQEPHRHTIRLETKNKRGTCPDQLLDQVVKCAHALGHTPSKPEFISWAGTQRYVHLIYKTFGSWTSAVEMAGLEERTKETVFKGFTDAQLIQMLRNYYAKYGQSPTESDFVRGLLPSTTTYRKAFGSIAKAREEAGIPQPVHAAKGLRYSDQYLLDQLKQFVAKHNRLPIRTDLGVKNAMPGIGIYQERFGGLVKARRRAGLPDKDLRGVNNKPELAFI